MRLYSTQMGLDIWEKPDVESANQEHKKYPSLILALFDPFPLRMFRHQLLALVDRNISDILDRNEAEYHCVPQ